MNDIYYEIIDDDNKVIEFAEEFIEYSKMGMDLERFARFKNLSVEDTTAILDRYTVILLEDEDNVIVIRRKNDHADQDEADDKEGS